MACSSPSCFLLMLCPCSCCDCVFPLPPPAWPCLPCQLLYLATEVGQRRRGLARLLLRALQLRLAETSAHKVWQLHMLNYALQCRLLQKQHVWKNEQGVGGGWARDPDGLWVQLRCCTAFESACCIEWIRVSLALYVESRCQSLRQSAARAHVCTSIHALSLIHI